MVLGNDKRGRVLAAAFKLFSAHGFHGTSMSMIAKESGVAVGTIYHYFKGKEEMIDVLYVELKKDCVNDMVCGFDDSLPTKEQFRHLWKQTARYYIKNPEIFKFVEQYANSPYISNTTKELRNKLMAPILNAVEKGFNDGILKPLPFGVMNSMFYGPLMMLIKNHLSDDLELTDELLDSAFEICWDGLST